MQRLLAVLGPVSPATYTLVVPMLQVNGWLCVAWPLIGWLTASQSVGILLLVG